MFTNHHHTGPGTSARRSMRSRTIGGALVLLLVTAGAACGGDDDDSSSDATTASTAAPTATNVAPVGDIEGFCQAELATEAATAAEDPAAISGAFQALTAAAPDEIKPAVDTAIAEAEVFLAADGEPSPAFETAYGQVLDYVAANCGFGELAATGSEYAFGGIPESIDAGPVVVSLTNTGAEIHMLALVRVNDGVTETAEELLALSEEEASSKVTDVGTAFAGPAETGRTVVDLQSGRYIALCFLPEGATPENMPAIQSGEHEGTPHAMLGMVQEFTVN